MGLTFPYRRQCAHTSEAFPAEKRHWWHEFFSGLAQGMAEGVVSGGVRPEFLSRASFSLSAFTISGCARATLVVSPGSADRSNSAPGAAMVTFSHGPSRS